LKYSNFVKDLLFIICGTFILSLIGFYNGYPLVYSDTGTYIYSGFDQFIPNDRPISYGLFLYLFSFNFSSWLVVLTQNFLTVFTIFSFIKIWKMEQKKLHLLFLSILILLTSITAIGWYSNQLMPDFFTPLVILSYTTLLLRRNASIATQILLSLILVYGSICHFSNLLMIGFIATLTTGFFFWKKPDFITKKKFYLVIMLAGLSWLVLPTINYFVEDEFSTSKGSHVFLMSHLCGTGILEQFLKENCDTEEYKDCKICEFKDQLPRDPASFIWSTDIVNQCGGWEGSKDEFNKIIKGTLTDFTYLKLNVFRSFTYGASQLMRNKVGEGLTPYIEHSAPYGQIHWRFRNELNDYLESKQNAYGGVNLKFENINLFQNILLFLSVLVLFIILYNRALIPPVLLFSVFIVISGIVLNSFITAGLNTAYARYQARVVWLLPFAITWVSVCILKIDKSKFLNWISITDTKK